MHNKGIKNHGSGKVAGNNWGYIHNGVAIFKSQIPFLLLIPSKLNESLLNSKFYELPFDNSSKSFSCFIYFVVMIENCKIRKKGS